MGKYDNLDELTLYRTAEPFSALSSIRWRANRIFRDREASAWQAAAPLLESWISDYKETKVAEETEAYIAQRAAYLSREGGWELQYLSCDSYDPLQSPHPADESEIRHLLENWPSWADEDPGLPSEEDFADLDVVHEILTSGYPYDDIDGFCLASEAEIYAVLAMMKINEAAGWLHIPEKRTETGIRIYPGPNPWSAKSVINAGQLLIEAMEIICYAERERSDAQLSEMRAAQRLELVQQIRAESRKENARKGGLAKNRQAGRAKTFVQLEWASHRKAYNENKSEFSRHYVKRVKNEFDVTVTEKQMREVWLRDYPPASKPAG